MKNRKNLIAITAAIILSVTSSGVYAADIPPEAVPCNADEQSIVTAENLIGNVLTETENGLGYADAKNKSNVIIFNAVINNQTNGYGYGILSAIANNAIYQYRDMYLRPEYYAEAEKEIKVLIADLITAVENGSMDYETARKESYIRIYKSVNPAFNAEEQFSLDICYRDVPAVDSAKFTVARKLLLNARRDVK